MLNPLSQDLDGILDQTRDVWEEIRGNRIFITGGTGFFGCWLLESFVWAQDKLDLGARAAVLTRDPAKFRAKAPHLADHSAVELIEGDVCSFAFPEGRFSHVIHAATESSTGLNERRPLAMLDTIIGGTRRVLDFAVHAGARKFLLTSSGAVYGEQPADVPQVAEDYRGGPDPANPASAYGEGKRVAELLCAIYHKQHGIETKIARCFAFVGPYLPLDAHYAIGNFIGDKLEGRDIQVNSDGKSRRSYLYAADLAIWLWKVLSAGLPGTAYNVGSDEDLSIAGTAEAVAAFEPRSQVRILGASKNSRSSIYVPNTEKARRELRLGRPAGLRSAIERTLLWQESGKQKCQTIE